MPLPRAAGARRLLFCAAIACVLGAASAAAHVLPGETGCGKLTLRGDFAGRADIVVVRHRADCVTARRVAHRAASRRTRFGAGTPAPSGWTCMASFRPSLGYTLRHAVTCQRGRGLRGINRPAVAIALPAAPLVPCGDVRVDRALRANPRGAFGAFGIHALYTGCRTARTLARDYIHRPNAPAHRTRVDGWECAARPVGAAQKVAVRCTRGGATVRFRDRIPNG